MNKLKIERGISRVKRSKLQSSIDQSVAKDIELMAEWSDNEQNYIVNELLRFAISQAEDFQKYKVGRASRPTGAAIASTMGTMATSGIAAESSPAAPNNTFPPLKSSPGQSPKSSVATALGPAEHK